MKDEDFAPLPPEESKTARVARGARRTQEHVYAEKHYFYVTKPNGAQAIRWRWEYPSETIKWNR